jgi:hypothetical protein
VFRRRQRFTVDDLDHLVNPTLDAAVEIALAECRRDGLGDDAVGGGICQGALQALTHLDAQAVVVFGDDEQRAIIDARAVHHAAAELPLLGHADGVLLDLLRLRGGHDQHRELRALGGLEGGELLLKRSLLLSRQRAGEVGDAGGELGDRLLVLGSRGQAEAEQPQQRKARKQAGAARRAPHFVGCGGGVAAGVPGVEVSKLTVGAAEMACSFATVKFGFTWKPKILAVRFCGKERTVTL